MATPRFLRFLLFPVEDPVLARAEDNPLHEAMRVIKPPRQLLRIPQTRFEWKTIGQKAFSLEGLSSLAPIILIGVLIWMPSSLMWVGWGGFILASLLLYFINIFRKSVDPGEVVVSMARPELLSGMLDERLDSGFWLTPASPRVWFEALYLERNDPRIAPTAVWLGALLFAILPWWTRSYHNAPPHSWVIYLGLLGLSTLLFWSPSKVVYRTVQLSMGRATLAQWCDLLRPKSLWRKTLQVVLLGVVVALVFLLGIFMFVFLIELLGEIAGSVLALYDLPREVFEWMGALGRAGFWFFAIALVVHVIARCFQRFPIEKWNDQLRRAEVIIPAYVGDIILADDDAVPRLEEIHGPIEQYLKPAKGAGS